MKIGFLSYVNPLVANGGGELVVREVLQAAQACGHEIVMVNLWPVATLPKRVDVDGWIVADVHNVPERQTRLDQRLCRRIPGSRVHRFHRFVAQALRESYVHFDNAYVDTCDLAYLPCGGVADGEGCPLRPGQPCFRSKTAPMYEGARASFFLSPLHAEVVGRLQPSIVGRTRLLRPAIDPEPFLAARRPPADRDIEWLYAGALSAAKGTDRLGDVEPLTIVTGRDAGPRPTAATVHTAVPPQEMPAWFGRARRFVFRPTWPEPFGRVVAEAALAGCELRVDGAVGACSYGEDLSDPAFYDGTAERFWREVAELLAVPSR